MPRITKPLTDSEIRAAKPKEKEYKLFDGGGLYLSITPKNKKWWRLKYKLAGKDRLISLGVYPTVTLQQARRQREETKALISAGVDPAEKRRTEKEAARQKEERIKNTFEALTDAYFEHAATLEDAPTEKTMHRNKRRIENHCYPTLKNVPAEEITEADIIDILSVLKAKGYHEIARRVLMFVKQILRYGVKHQILKYNVAADLSAKEEIGLRVGENYPIITDKAGLKALLVAIDSYAGDPSTAKALKIMPYLAFRPSNIRFLEWGEVDLDNKIITISADKMKKIPSNKTKRDYRSPISRQVANILQEVHKYSGGGKYVFPSPIHRDRALSENTLNVGLRRLGYTKEQIVSHSFRGIFSTITHDRAGEHKCSSLAIEFQLAHKDRNDSREAYQRGDLLDERKRLMQWWADHIDKIKEGE